MAAAFEKKRFSRPACRPVSLATHFGASPSYSGEVKRAKGGRGFCLMTHDLSIHPIALSGPGISHSSTSAAAKHRCSLFSCYQSNERRAETKHDGARVPIRYIFWFCFLLYLFSFIHPLKIFLAVVSLGDGCLGLIYNPSVPKDMAAGKGGTENDAPLSSSLFLSPTFLLCVCEEKGRAWFNDGISEERPGSVMKRAFILVLFLCERGGGVLGKSIVSQEVIKHGAFGVG
jgi:hypothetical protein